MYLLFHSKENPGVGFEVLTAVVMKSVNRRFGGTHRLHLQGRKNNFSKKVAWKQVSTCFHSGFLLVDTQLTPRRYIPEDGTLQRKSCFSLALGLRWVPIRVVSTSALNPADCGFVSGHREQDIHTDILRNFLHSLQENDRIPLINELNNTA
jgi:hypothetical protein